MRRYTSNLAFVDLLFNMLIGFLCLFIIALMYMNPIAKSGTIDPPIEVMIEMTWDDESENDIDMYMLLPNKKLVYYGNRDVAPAILKRDDLGKTNDRFVLNGDIIEIRQNYEVITLTKLVDGDYFVNAHFFSKSNDGKEEEEVKIKITNVKSFSILAVRTRELSFRGEKSYFTFTVKDGEITEIDDDIDILLRNRRVSTQ